MVERSRKEAAVGRAQSSGTCVSCGGEHPKPAMARHLANCERRSRGTEERLSIAVEGAWAPEYWLHVEVKPRATLRDLDDFLRETWLECCGHMSSFEIGDRRYESSFDDLFESDAESMDVPVGEVLKAGVTAKYTYDFGSSTKLRLRVLTPRLGKASSDLVRLAARNNPPSINCKSGHSEAQNVCSSCGQPLCQECSPKHRCGPEMLLPIVNSPRVGTCAYGT
jgi:Plasmid pRiA4b ORF-3-like protein